MPGRIQQVDDLMVMKDVRRDAPRLRAEGELLRYFGLRLKLFKVTGEVANPRETCGLSRWCAALPFILFGPVDHKIGRKGPPMLVIGNIAGKPSQQRTSGMQFETKTLPFIEIVINPLLQADARAHAALPGQGKATAANFGVSSLA